MAKLGLAPRLWGVQDIPGGWKMVVMDKSDNTALTYMPHCRHKDGHLESSPNSYSEAADGGYVHGDIQDVNSGSGNQIHIIDL